MLALVVGVSAMVNVSSAGAALTSDEVAEEMVRVQLRADEAADQWMQAQVRAEQLAADLVSAQAQLDLTEAQYAQLEDDLATIAVRRYTGVASSALPFFGDPSEQLQTSVLRGVALDEGSTELDVVESVRSELADDRARVEAIEQQNQQLADAIQQQQADLETQLVQLEALRGQLLDKEVAAAYEARIAEQRRIIAEQQAAAAAVVAVATPAVQQPRGNGTAAATPVTVSPAVVPSAPGADEPAAPTPAEPAAAPVPAPAPKPAPQAPTIVSGSGGWVCPVAGPTAFGDTWGAARSGGRSHEGVDMMSPEGTPLVAVVSGSVLMKTTRLGGNSMWLTGVDGHKYFYAHLSAWEGSSRSVSAGEVIGYVGHTGNTTANHLHFEIHPGGGAAINPYPTVRANC